MRGLYPIVDVETLSARGLSAIELAERVLQAKPPLLQLRAKKLDSRRTLALLRQLVPLCRASETLLVANDRADLALLAGADAVHVGQDDLPIAELRRIAPKLRIGVSTHDLRQLETVLRDRPDYVAFGPVFATRSKENPDPVVGLDGLRRAADLARAAHCPLVAIGGIDLENARAVSEHADLGAVISALVPASSDLSVVAENARALHERLGGAAR
jgi:thiamine-phosphate pyrophosphorylase